MQEISYEETLALEDTVYIDVRSPGEYSEDHIPGALNLPIFSDTERAEIGTLYKMAGRDSAVIRGTEIVGGKLGDIVSTINSLRERNIVISCARGGMRSDSLAALAGSLGIKVFKLKSGYKGYRNFVVNRIASVKIGSPLFVLQGLTGTGKTEIINGIDNSIDLEMMAGHRSSLFGGMGLEQKGQKTFESSLVKRIRELESSEYIVIEGESRKIGNLHIPDNIFSQMRNAPVILVEADIDRRAGIILQEYTKKIEPISVAEIVKSLKMKLGQKTIDELLEHLSNKNYFEFIKILLEKYYDPLYSHSLGTYSYIATVKNEDTEQAIMDVISIIHKYI